MLLDAEVQAGIVVDRPAGRGLVTADMIAERAATADDRVARGRSR